MEIDPATAAQASAMFRSAAAEGPREPASDRAARARFDRVVARVRPVAEAFCRQETEGRAGTACSAAIGIDTRMAVPNAYFTYRIGDRRQPVIKVTLPMLRDLRNDDELAFVLGHEYGHLVGQHIVKRQQQAVAGALLVGVVAAAAAQGAENSQQVVEDGIRLGGAIGARAFSQTFELESDTIGTLIARGAGYDPVLGARYFARPAEAGSRGGELSFWGTHPPDERRLATVMATVRRIEAGAGIERASPR